MSEDKVNYNNFLRIFTVNIEAWVFSEEVGVNIETGKFYYCKSVTYNIGAAYGSDISYKAIDNQEDYYSYIDEAYKNKQISLQEVKRYKEINRSNWREKVDQERYKDKVKELEKQKDIIEKSKLIIDKDKIVSEDQIIEFTNHFADKFKLDDFNGFKYESYSLNNGEYIYLRKVDGKFRLFYYHGSYSIPERYIKDEESISQMLNDDNFISDNHNKIKDRELNETEVKYILSEIDNRLSGEKLKKEYNYNEHIGCYGDFSFEMIFKDKKIITKGNDYFQCETVYDFVTLVEKIAFYKYRI